MSKIKSIYCPACHQAKPGFIGDVGPGNAFSRYVDTYICSDCGTREALEKFFWADRCPAVLLRKSAKRRGMSVRDLVSMCIVAGAMMFSGGHADAESPYGPRYTWSGPYGTITTQCNHSVYGVNCRTTMGGAAIGNDARVIRVPDEDYPTPSARTCASPSVVCLEAGK